MAEIEATISWERGDAVFANNRYSRAHLWTFDGGVEVPASSSPHVVPLPYSVAENVDPEEAFVAALSSCHMLSFLWVAAKRKIVVDDYRDRAIGLMTKSAEGRVWVSKVTLHPVVSYAGEAPDRATEEQMHHEAHEECFIANSVRTEVVTELGA